MVSKIKLKCLYISEWLRSDDEDGKPALANNRKSNNVKLKVTTLMVMRRFKKKILSIKSRKNWK